MYFSSELFVKRSPLGHLWLAGTVFHKLSKKVILSCNVPEMCNSIKQPPIPLALPARAQLFLGVCRIIDKQAKYLLVDATEAQSRVQLVVCSNTVNLTTNRVQAKSDNISFVCNLEDYVLPPIPLDCFEGFLENETALLLQHSNPEQIGVIENSNLLENSHLDFDTNLPPQDIIVGLEKTLFDPLAVSEVPDQIDASHLLAREFGFNDDDPLPEIGLGDADERRQSQASVNSKTTADTFNVSVISRKRKRNRPKPDSKIDINIDVLKHELADTSRVVSLRPKFLEESPIIIDQNDQLRCMRSAIICELSDVLQASYDLESRRERCMAMIPEMELDDDQQQVLSQDGFHPIVESRFDNLSFNSEDISIEKARRLSFLSSDQNRAHEATFLGHEIGLPSPSVDSLGSDSKFSPKQIRRVSMKSLGSLDSGAKRLSLIDETGVSDFQTPDLNATLSQFVIPCVEVEVEGDRTLSGTIGHATEILRSILDNHFQSIQAPQGKKICQFHSIIENAVGPTVRVSRRDAAMSFFQLLVLKSLGMITIEQTKPYGSINISRTSSFSS